jgi:hypothetical protein
MLTGAGCGDRVGAHVRAPPNKEESNMSEVPEYLPRLRAGNGAAPSEGGCLVQVANWLADHDLWTDRAKHVHPVLARFGIWVNDRVDANTRRELALAACRIAGTYRDQLTPAQQTELNAWAAELFLRAPGPGEQPRECSCPACAQVPFNGMLRRDDLPAQEKVDRYFLLVEMFEELSGHQPRAVPEEEWAELAMAMTRPELAPQQVTKQVTKQMISWTPTTTGNYVVTWSGNAVTAVPAEQSISAGKITAAKIEGNIVVNSGQSVKYTAGGWTSCCDCVACTDYDEVELSDFTTWSGNNYASAW